MPVSAAWLRAQAREDCGRRGCFPREAEGDFVFSAAGAHQRRHEVPAREDEAGGPGELVKEYLASLNLTAQKLHEFTARCVLAYIQVMFARGRLDTQVPPGAVLRLIPGVAGPSGVTFGVFVRFQLMERRNRKKSRREQQEEEAATILGLGERQKTFVQQQQQVREGCRDNSLARSLCWNLTA